ncbi:MAG: NusG domain II-containing protein [Spirochaetales bacterium]|nr:NusG domain II-containing protein [Spirochaetales bacterium]
MAEQRRRRSLRRLLRELPVKPYDYVIFAVAAAVIVAFAVFAVEQGGQATTVEVRSDEGDFVYALDEDRVLSFSGPLGETIIHIQDGTVRFVASPCRDKICIAAGALSEHGQWAACLPNRVFVTISGGETGAEVDATAF